MPDWVVALGPTAGCVVITLAFIKYLNTLKKADEKRETERLATISAMAEGCHQHSEKITQVMSSAMNESKDVIANCTHQLGRIESLIDRRLASTPVVAPKGA